MGARKSSTGKPSGRILIVDDSVEDRDMYAQFFTLKGYLVSEAQDGKEGLEKAIELHPDIVVMDLWLPKMSGWEVIRYLKNDQRTKDIPILVVTGHSSVRPLECAGWLAKPCQLDQLDAEIASILKARNGRVKKLVPINPPELALPDLDMV